VVTLRCCVCIQYEIDLASLAAISFFFIRSLITPTITSRIHSSHRYTSSAHSSRRMFQAFLNRVTIKSNIAFVMLQWGKFSRGKAVLDPFCGSGTILLEAAEMVAGVSKRSGCRRDHMYMKTHTHLTFLLALVFVRRVNAVTYSALRVSWFTWLHERPNLSSFECSFQFIPPSRWLVSGLYARTPVQLSCGCF
jgi:hypothetical protein